MQIKLSQYTAKTSGRYRDSGEYSGEWFLEDILWPILRDSEEKIEINSDTMTKYEYKIHSNYKNRKTKFRRRKII